MREGKERGSLWNVIPLYLPGNPIPNVYKYSIALPNEVYGPAAGVKRRNELAYRVGPRPTGRPKGAPTFRFVILPVLIAVYFR